MKRVVFRFVVVAAIAVSAVVVTSCGNAQAQGGGSGKVERWEYKCFRVNSFEQGMEAQLNSLGAEGWELVFKHTSSSSECIFKRRLP